MAEQDGFYRALIRVEPTDDADMWAVWVPSWNSYPVKIWKATIPTEFQNRHYLLCRVNIGAKHPGDLRFIGPWEVAPEPDPNDGLGEIESKAG